LNRCSQNRSSKRISLKLKLMWDDSILAGSGEMAWGFAFSPDWIRFTDSMPGLLTFDPFRVARWAMGIFYKHLTLLSLYPIKRDSALKRGTIRRAKPKRLHIEFSAEFVDALAKRNPHPSCTPRFLIYRNKGWGFAFRQKTHSSYTCLTVAGLVVVILLLRVAFATLHSPGAINI